METVDLEGARYLGMPVKLPPEVAEELQDLRRRHE